MSDSKPDNPVGRFVLKVLIWLPISFFIWYALAGPLLWPMQPLLELGFGMFSDLVEQVRMAHGRLLFETTLEAQVADGRTGLVTAEINALKYTYNLPLLVALLYAASDRHFSFKRLAAIYLLLLPFQIFGVTFDFLAQMLFHAGPEVAAQVGITGWGRELVALGYQFGYLMLPPISAAAIWFWMNKELVVELMDLEPDSSS
ncbi:MAG: exosortase H-associated membrane protein [Halothiobacillaceae bacterium]